MGQPNPQKPEKKKGLPGGFLLFFVAIVMLIMGVQALFNDDKVANVSFSHQLEHLVNLQLLHPSESKKVAQNDNLVTFSGQFRERLTEEGKQRYDYLSFLQKDHELDGEKQYLTKELDQLQIKVKNAADWYVQIASVPIPASGYEVVSSSYDTSARLNGITLTSTTGKNLLSYSQLERLYVNAKMNPSEASLATLGSEFERYYTQLQSPRLGIGSEGAKKTLKSLKAKLDVLVSQPQSAKKIEELVSGFGSLLAGYKGLIDQLNISKDHVRLLDVRSVRNYTEALLQFSTIAQALEVNGQKLDQAREKVADVIWFFNNEELSNRLLEKQDPEVFNHWFAKSKEEWENFSASQGLVFKAVDQPRNAVLERTFKSQQPAPNYFSYIITFLPIIMIVLVLYFLFARQMKGGGVGSSTMNFGKSPARLLTKETNKITFKDVAGVEEAKEELSEIVDFLRDPHKFTSLGARIPKGVLLVGPPGTGKTLVAKAVAGEADRPFFSISGSDFVEMFVGVGASRVRDLFAQAKKNSPCIIFMDEIDAVGRHRGSGVGGGHDEREQTLNQLLVEMDGFDTQEGVILMAATNRPDVLDKALLRPGRFDRRVSLDLPDVKGRYEILKVHARKIKIDPSVELLDIAKNTPGSSGADLENILNEAALLAARRGRTAVTSSEATEACDKVRFGKERRSLEMDEEEKRTTAFHESGHTMVGLKVERSDPVEKVTIIPRGFSLGATHFMPKKNRLSYWKKEVLDQLAILLGGRAAEELFVNDMSSGASHDITQATKLARAMVCEWGMSDTLGTVTYDESSQSGQYLGMGGYHERTYSDETAQIIDKEVKTLIEDAHKRAIEIVEENREKVQLMADMLIQFETLDKRDIQEIVDGSWDEEKKKKRLKLADELQKQATPPPPPKKKENEAKSNISDDPNPRPQGA